jgi:hypothetical protein
LNPGLDGFRQVGVVENDVRAFASELERDALDGLRSELGDTLASAGRPGEADHVDTGVSHDRFTHDRAGAADEIEHAGRQLGLVDDLGEHERAERGDLARFENDRASGRESGSYFGGHLMERVIPRRDAAHDAHRLAQDDRIADLFVELVAREKLRVDAEGERRQTDLYGSGERHRHADLLRDDLGNLLRPCDKTGLDFLEVDRALLRARC